MWGGLWVAGLEGWERASEVVAKRVSNQVPRVRRIVVHGEVQHFDDVGG